MIELKRKEWQNSDSDNLNECQGAGWTLENMKDEVFKGNLGLYGVFREGKHVASILLRNEFPRLVIVAGGGKTIEGSTYKTVLPIVDNFAKKNGFKELQCYAKDAARARLLQMAGWKLQEYVFNIEVK